MSKIFIKLVYARMFDEKESFIKTTLTDGKPSHHVSFFTKRNFELI